MSNRRVLVVGTTADYVDIIHRRFPHKAVFITDGRERAKAQEPAPGADAELLCDLSRPEQVVAAVRVHLDRWRTAPSGIACFDCESMPLAALLAHSLGLAYPSADAVAACRSKYVSKQVWRRAGLSCPDVELVRDASAAARFLRKTAGPVVLKPLTGSGSELVFLCADEDQCAIAFATLESRLAVHSDQRMYASHCFNGMKADPRRDFVIEQFVQGAEYSCDFVVDGDRARILRIAAKIPDRGQPFGTTLAYVLPARLPSGIGRDELGRQLCRAARALGLDRAICMLDFIMRDDRVFLIELAPRAGGDCLPPLLLQSCGMDILGRALDFAEGGAVNPPSPSRWRSLVGVRLFATEGGEIGLVDDSDLRRDRRVVESCLRRRSGHRVVLPPEDYDSRLLGHVIFEPSGPEIIETQCVEIAAKLKLEMKTEPCVSATAS